MNNSVQYLEIPNGNWDNATNIYNKIYGLGFLLFETITHYVAKADL
jgi:hypothetical protein